MLCIILTLTSGKVLNGRIYSLFPLLIEDDGVEDFVNFQRSEDGMPVILLQAANVAVQDAFLDPSANASQRTDGLKRAQALVVSCEVLSATLAYLNSFHPRFVYFSDYFPNKAHHNTKFPAKIDGALSCDDPYHF